MTAAAVPSLLTGATALTGSSDLLAIASYLHVDEAGRIHLTLEVSPPADDPETSRPSHLQFLGPDHEAVVAWRAQWLRDRETCVPRDKTSIPLSATLHALHVTRNEPANADADSVLLVSLELRLSR